jgi:hypothetical protein
MAPLVEQPEPQMLPAPLQRQVNNLIASAVRVDGIAQKFDREELLGYVYGIASSCVGRCRDNNMLVLRDLYGQTLVFEAIDSLVYIYFNFPGTEACDGEDGGPKRLVFNASTLQDIKSKLASVPIVPANVLALGLK